MEIAKTYDELCRDIKINIGIYQELENAAKIKGDIVAAYRYKDTRKAFEGLLQ